jgi:diamine N-acetyltransferase
MSTIDRVTIRRAEPEDAEALSGFAARLFHETYAAFNRPEDMRAYVSEHFTPLRMAEEIASPSVRVLVAEAGAQLTGYMYLRQAPAPSPISGATPVELTRVYVDASWQGHGLAACLLERCLREARAWGGDVLWLAVWQENARAIRFYQKQGFQIVGTQSFQLGEEVNEDYLMVCALVGSET